VDEEDLTSRAPKAVRCDFSIASPCFYASQSGGTVFPVSDNSSSSGGMARIGIAWAFAGPWSARAEYDFIGLPTDFIGLTNRTFTVTGPRRLAATE